MVVIRLARGGSKKKPFYRVVVADSRAKRDGRFIERVGHYDPIASSLRIDLTRFSYWKERGAQPSLTVARLARKMSSSSVEVLGGEASSG